MISFTMALLLSGWSFILRLSSHQGSFPRPLTKEEEKQALQRLAEGDMAARELLILHNLRLVAHVIKKYYTTASDQDDLISIGTIGLIKAVSTYKPEKHVKLPTYAGKCIQNEIFMYFRNQKRRTGELSLNDSIDTEREGENLELLDVVYAEDMNLTNLEEEETQLQIRRLVNTSLSSREQAIINARYGLTGEPPRTQREIAAQLGISRSYVSRIEKRALKVLEERYLAETEEK